MTSFIDYLKESSDCLYIYNRNFSIYGLDDIEQYTIVVTDDWVCPEDWIGFDSGIYHIYKLSEWFDIVLTGELIGWECACLNKKYVIKEYVKLLMTTDPVQLRKTIDYEIKDFDNLTPLEKWEVVKDIKFANQIIENHKIVNFKEAASDVVSDESSFEVIEKPYARLRELTDGMLKKELLKKAKTYKDE